MKENEFQFLLSEFNNAQEDIRVVGERRYNIIKYYSSLIIAIISALSATYAIKELPNESRLLLTSGAIIIGALVIFLLCREQINIVRTLNKINSIRGLMRINFLKKMNDKQKRDIHMDTRYMRWFNGLHGKVSFYFAVIVVGISIAFVAYLFFLTGFKFPIALKIVWIGGG